MPKKCQKTTPFFNPMLLLFMYFPDNEPINSFAMYNNAPNMCNKCSIVMIHKYEDAICAVDFDLI